MQKRKWFIWFAVAIALLWVGVLAVAKWVETKMNAGRVDAQPAAELATYWQAPAFSFVDQDGKTVTDQSLRGNAWIADFFFSQCTSACPILTSKLILLQKQITSPGVKFISFSVDPDNDTPAALKKYAQLWQGDESRWRLLSTDAAGLAKVATGMRVTVAPSGDKDNPILHSTMFMLVDAAGQVRGIYDSNDSDAVTQLVSDARAISGNTASLNPAANTIATTAVERGRTLFGSMGCLACHSQVRIAPPLHGLYGSIVRLDNRQMVWADEAYLHESIVDPYAKVVAGYTKSMPNYRDYLDVTQIMDVVAYLKSLSSNQPGGHGVVAGAANAPSQELIVDPVCQMQVVADVSAPHADYKGRRFYFCSDHCRLQFLRNPEHYSLTPNTMR